MVPAWPVCRKNERTEATVEGPQWIWGCEAKKRLELDLSSRKTRQYDEGKKDEGDLGVGLWWVEGGGS